VVWISKVGKAEIDETPIKIAKAMTAKFMIELGEASYVTEGGCRVWVIKGYEQMSPRF